MDRPARPAADRGGLFGVGFTGQFAMIEWPAAALGATPEALTGLQALWEQRPSGMFVQVGLACLGLSLIVGAALPVPGARTRPSTYFVRSYGDPLRDFFTDSPAWPGSFWR